MGIVNVTPDSFSDGGRFESIDAAVKRGALLWEQGAAVVDVGGESTRPGAGRVSAEVELLRVLDVVTELSSAGVVVSVDTTRASVARRCVDAGATVVNDVSGGLADPAMADVVADSGAVWVLNHSRGTSRDMYASAVYTDVVSEVRDELVMRVEDAVNSGVPQSSLILDPGLGFAKYGRQNWDLLAHLDVLVDLGLPVLVGASRKRFLAAAIRGGEHRAATDRDDATVAVTIAAALAGVWGVRVHQASASVDAIAVLSHLRHGVETEVGGRGRVPR
ncbi:dihydropteroate synthase [Rhodococcus sp. Leaf225]|nr:dihydropteroate synthase [Rhodococcus sp. Leaf225]KQU39885.1 dihydropteroate synthase [Rhodococcus sp. Leaf258]